MRSAGRTQTSLRGCPLDPGPWPCDRRPTDQKASRSRASCRATWAAERASECVPDDVSRAALESADPELSVVPDHAGLDENSMQDDLFKGKKDNERRDEDAMEPLAWKGARAGVDPGRSLPLPGPAPLLRPRARDQPCRTMCTSLPVWLNPAGARAADRPSD